MLTVHILLFTLEQQTSINALHYACTMTSLEGKSDSHHVNIQHNDTQDDDTQYNDTEHIGTQYNDTLKAFDCDTQHKG
jgi:hypothetical protein